MGAILQFTLSVSISDPRIEEITALRLIKSVSFDLKMGKQPTTTADVLLVSLVFLIMGGVSSRQFCDHKRCLFVVPERYDFEGSRKHCEERNGHLMTVQSSDLHKELLRLLRGYTGNYWIGLQLPGDKCPDGASPLRGYRWVVGADKATGFTNWGAGWVPHCAYRCVSVGPQDNSTWRQESCDDTGLQGFVCEVPLVAPCAPLALGSGGDSYAKYTLYTYPDSPFEESALYPGGTVAVTEPSGFKYLCNGQWMSAPWACGLLDGGCEEVCRDGACACAPGKTLGANNVTCVSGGDPCSDCAHRECLKTGDGYRCQCRSGYRLAEDGKGCLDVDECLEDPHRCDHLKHSECRNVEALDGGYECQCAEGYELEDGECVNLEICLSCEHMMCDKRDGAYQCSCRDGFVVWDKDPTRCQQHCNQPDCPAICIHPSDPKEESDCYCPDGYIKDRRDGAPVCTDIDECEQAQQCDHECANTYGSYTCSCKAGFELYGVYKCRASGDGASDDRARDDGASDDGSGGSTTPLYVSAPNAIVYPTAIPPYVKTGSVLGIVVFIALFMGLLSFLVHRSLRRCRTFEIPSLRGADVDIFHLQQVMTEKYKRFSFDQQWDNNVHQRQ